MQETSKRPNVRSWSRFFRPRFSLRTLLVVITIICVLLGAWFMPSYRQYRVAQQIIADHGGRVLLSGDEYTVQKYNSDYNEYFSSFGNYEDEHHWYDYFWQNVVSVRCNISSLKKYDWASLPHLQRINVVGLPQSDNDGPDVRTPNFLTMIPNRSQITTLAITINLEVFDYTETDFALIEEFINLETLILRGHHQLTRNELAQLAKLKHLKNLFIQYSHGKPPFSLHELANCQSLERLVFIVDGEPIGDYHFLSKLKSLKELQMYADDISNETLSHIAKLVHLENLHLGSNGGNPLSKIDDEGFANFQNLKDLESFSIDRTSLNGTSAKYFAGLPKLGTLQMDCWNLSRAGLEEIVKLKQVESLDLFSWNESDILKKLSTNDLKLIATMTQLKRLNITETYADDCSIEPLSTMPNLEEIRLSDIDDKLFAPLLKMKNLKKVKFFRAGSGVFRNLTDQELRPFKERNIEVDEIVGGPEH